MEFSHNDRLFLAFSAALGFIVAGTGNALFGPRTQWIRLLMASAGLAVSVGAGFALIPESVDAIALSGVGLLFLLILAQSGMFQRFLTSVGHRLQKPRLAWGLVALAGFGVLGFEFSRFDVAEVADLNAHEAWLKLQEVTPYTADDSRAAKTDRGSIIHLLTTAEAKTVDLLFATETQTLQSTRLDDYVIRRGPPDDNSNCHGWVFTGGKYAIRGHEVDTILVENEYQPSTIPRAGDLCVYRNESNLILHTALVRSVFDDGTILVESKWGHLGVFLHSVQHSVYGMHFNFYHSVRSTHLLNSIP
jgi:hypothetical protein